MSLMTAPAVPAVEASPEVAERVVAEHLLLVTTAHPSLHQHGDETQAVHRNLGRLLQPRHTSSAELTALAGIPWAADNDCFQGLDPHAFVKMLDRLQGVPGCRFVTVPDVVGDAYETAKQFEIWAPALERRGLPVALVLQNGIDRPALKRWLDRTWHRLDAVFIGGDDDFKLGPIAAELAREAKRRGLWVHWGRVNSRKRMKHCIETGACDSVDGSMWARFRKTHLDKGLRWLVELTEEREARDAQLALDTTTNDVPRLRLAEEETMEPTFAKDEAGEDGIRRETVIVTERNVAQQVVREVEVERVFEAGRVRQTTVRAEQFETVTSEAHELRALPTDEAQRYVRDAEERGLLTVPVVPVHELAEGDECLTRDGRVVAFRSHEEHGFDGCNAQEVCGVGTLARRLTTTTQDR